MIPLIQGSSLSRSLSQDSFLNRTPRDNSYISGYEGPNEIYQDSLEREWTILSMVKFSDPEDKIVTCSNPYNFAMMNSIETCHLGKTLISPNW